MAENNPGSEIRNAMFRRMKLNKSMQRFSTLDVQEIWNSNQQLERFMSFAFGPVEPEIIEFARENLLNTLSTLVISQFPNWQVFWDIWVRTRDTFPDRTDEKLPFWDWDELLSLLGAEWAMAFRNHHKVFTAIVVVEGQEHEGYERTPPYTGKSTVIGVGQRREVLKNVIMRGHLKLKDHDGNLREEIGNRVVAIRQFGPIEEDKVAFLRVLRKDPGVREHFATYLSMIWNHEASDMVDILYPFADVDLHKFLREDEYQQHRLGRIDGLVRQIQHVAEALAFLHENLWNREDFESTQYVRFGSCHLDLKPKNILVFGLQENTVGDWKLSDFAVSKVLRLKERNISGLNGEHKHGSVIRSVWPDMDANRYQAPEIERKKMGGGGRESDIWSLGCICVEAIAAGLGLGMDLENMITAESNGQMSENDYFYHLRTIGSSKVNLKIDALKPRVRDWVKSDFSGGEGNNSQRRQWILHQTRTLVLSMLKPRKRSRPTADRVASRLRSILQRAGDGNEPSA
ncbi:kinase-like domain-containing protein [Nemania sp. NC0429]|nr:kinase-like domain-containing protein [Nemania sp. NC0429]